MVRTVHKELKFIYSQVQRGQRIAEGHTVIELSAASRRMSCAPQSAPIGTKIVWREARAACSRRALSSGSATSTLGLPTCTRAGESVNTCELVNASRNKERVVDKCRARHSCVVSKNIVDVDRYCSGRKIRGIRNSRRAGR